MEDVVEVVKLAVGMFVALVGALMLILHFTGTRVTKEERDRDTAIAKLATAMTAMAATVTKIDERLTRTEGEVSDMRVEVATKRGNGAFPTRGG